VSRSPAADAHHVRPLIPDMSEGRLRLSTRWTWIGRASTAPIIGLIGLAIVIPAYIYQIQERHRLVLFSLAAIVAVFVLESITNYDIRTATIDGVQLELSWLGKRTRIPLSQVRVVGTTSLPLGKLSRLTVVEVEYRLSDGRGEIVQFIPSSTLSQGLLEHAIVRASHLTTSAV